MRCDALVFLDATVFCNNFMLPKRRFWKSERTFGNAFLSTFQRVSTRFGYVPLKVLRKCVPKCSFGLPKSSFGEHKVVTKDNSIPETNTSHVAIIFCSHLAKFLQRQQHPIKPNTSHVATIFCNHLAKLLQRYQKTQHITCCYYLLNHLAELLQKFMAHPRKPSASHVAIIFCKLVTKDSINRTNASYGIAYYHLLYHLANFMLPKRRFWKSEQKNGRVFRGTLQGCEYTIWATNG